MKIESEKLLERKLKDALKLRGGWGLKLLTNHIKGLPDRLCLLPGGVVFFAEIKTTTKKPGRIQKFIHTKLENLGFNVYIIDNSNQIEGIINGEKRELTELFRNFIRTNHLSREVVVKSFNKDEIRKEAYTQCKYRQPDKSIRANHIEIGGFIQGVEWIMGELNLD